MRKSIANFETCFHVFAIDFTSFFSDCWWPSWTKPCSTIEPRFFMKWIKSRRISEMWNLNITFAVQFQFIQCLIGLKLWWGQHSRYWYLHCIQEWFHFIFSVQWITNKFIEKWEKSLKMVGKNGKSNDRTYIKSWALLFCAENEVKSTKEAQCLTNNKRLSHAISFGCRPIIAQIAAISFGFVL